MKVFLNRMTGFIILHVPGVAKVDSTLVSALVASVLKANDSLASTQLFLGKLTYILLCFLGSNAWLAKVVCLSAKGLQADDH